MIGILDYGMGNLGSVVNACAFLGLPAEVLSSADGLARCRGLILPGQGAFRDCMRHLAERGFVDPLRAWIRAERPFLGVCIGIQVLFPESEESPGVAGLGVFPGRVRRFAPAPGLKIPQMGWNRVRWERAPGPVFEGLAQDSFYYFVHSYYVETPRDDLVAATTEHGVRYCSALRAGRVAATQFHPEKSQAAGLAVLRNFGRLAQAG